MTANTKEYNGWKNWSTWNVALWMANDEGLYRSIQAYRQQADRNGKRAGYAGWLHWAGLRDEKTPDGAKFSAKCLDYRALDEVVRDSD